MRTSGIAPAPSTIAIARSLVVVGVGSPELQSDFNQHSLPFMVHQIIDTCSVRPAWPFVMRVSLVAGLRETRAAEIDEKKQERKYRKMRLLTN